jgi:hypothetical protein
MAPACNTGQCAALKALRGVRQVMAFSSRDWSVDPELWAIHRAAHGEDPTFTMLGRDARNESGIPTGAFVAPAQPRCQHLHGEGFVMCDQNRPEVMSRRTCDPSACTGLTFYHQYRCLTFYHQYRDADLPDVDWGMTFYLDGRTKHRPHRLNEVYRG